MAYGCCKEIKTQEYRVGFTPPSVAERSGAGHVGVVGAVAGAGIGFYDRDYVDVGAAILPDARAVFAAADMIVKVKEPQPQEIALLEPHHLLFTYLHLAADKPQTEGLIASGATCIANKTVTSPRSEEHTSELQSLMRISYAVFCLKKKHLNNTTTKTTT